MMGELLSRIVLYTLVVYCMYTFTLAMIYLYQMRKYEKLSHELRRVINNLSYR